MTLVLAAVACLIAGGLAALVTGRKGIGVGAAILGCAIGLFAAVRALAGEPTTPIRLRWDVPYGSFFVGMDPLSAFFLAAVFGLCGVAALYGGEYLEAYRGKKAMGPPWFFFNLLVASMAMVVIARNGILFLVAWEAMALSSLFLVTFEDEKPGVREAGWTYLVATHLGTAFLFVMFILLGRQSGSLDFDRFQSGGASSLLFLLAVVGFGTKAGLMPFHVWLPEAHPAAPSHVSAVMSGVMIKTGIYGIVRTLTFLGAPPAWWGWLLIGLGAVTGIGGVLFALAQRDLKRFLAYSSVENVGIVALGVGVGMLGITFRSPAVVSLGFGGAFLHVWNHALFKGLLFLGAGSVLHATGTREIERLGGLMKKLPVTGFCFLFGSVAISGLPPLNGFVSEFLIYFGAFRGVASLQAAVAVPALVGIAGLALIGGLAAAAFTRAAGIVFLGEPRSSHASHPHKEGAAMRASMLLLAASCVAIAFLSPWLLRGLGPVVRCVSDVEPAYAEAGRIVQRVVAVAGGFAALAAILALLRRALLAGRPVGSTVTWDCGYVKPEPRMQYTASSFGQPLTSLFGSLLRTRTTASPPEGLFPSRAALATETPDVCRESLFRPVFLGISWSVFKMKWIQHGRVHLYVLYIALALFVLFVWKLS